ncbi:MAG: MFS transporter [Anaerolineaceae bacterium]|jgi:hypothetical protein
MLVYPRSKRPLGLITLIFLSFIALGMPDGLLGVGWPTIRADFGIPLDAIGWLLFSVMSGYLASSFFSGELLKRWRVGKVLIVSCLITGAGLIGYTLVSSWWMMVALGVLAGLGAGVIDSGLNAYINNNPVNGTDPTGHYCNNFLLTDGGGLSLKGLFNEAHMDLYGEEPPKYYLRSDWSAWVPGSWNSVGGEGIFDEQSNPGGWKSYGLIPGRPPLNTILKDIVVHHIGDYAFGVGINNDLDLMKALETSERGSGYYDIAYHYGIGPSGEVFVGRNIGVRGAHVEDGNTGRVGIVLLGTFDDSIAPTEMMVKSLAALSVALSDYYGIQYIGGHRDFNQTQCPGDSTMIFVEQIQRELLTK